MIILGDNRTRARIGVIYYIDGGNTAPELELTIVHPVMRTQEMKRFIVH